MATIRNQFVCESDVVSQVIAWFGASQFSHVDALLDDGTLLGARSDSIGGKPPGVQIRPANYAKFTRKVVMALEVTDTQKATYLAFLNSQIGKPYDMKTILGFFVNRNWRQGGAWICSELLAEGIEQSGVLKEFYVPDNKITPGSWALAFSAMGGYVER
jgi:hypothetical protein